VFARNIANRVTSIWWRCGAALLSGVLLPCAFAPYDFWPLAVLSPACLLLLVRTVRPRSALLVGWCFGLGVFGHGVWWIQVSVHQFGVPYYIFSVGVTGLFVAGMAVYPALFSGLLSRSLRARAPILVVAPALWVGCEYLRGWLFTGFPWLTLGYSQTDGPLAGIAPLFGVFGCSAGLIFQATLLVQSVDSSAAMRAVWLALAVALGVAGQATSNLEFTEIQEAELSAALIQGAIPQALKWRRELRAASIETYIQLSEPHWDADVIVWPETAIPAFPHEVEEYVAELNETAGAHGVDLLVGMPTGEPRNGRYYNSIVDFGLTPGKYDKRHLVPFGEFFPFKNLISGLAMLLNIPLSDFSAGSAQATTLDVAGHRAGISICYEDAFGNEIRDGLPQAAFLVNISNDAWFGDTIAPHQHLQMARMRSLESGRFMLRATNTGISAIINERGIIVARGPQFVEATVAGQFQARTGATPYVRFGDVPVLILVCMLLAISVVVGLRSRRDVVNQ